jgi:hypothetical protein
MDRWLLTANRSNMLAPLRLIGTLAIAFVNILRQRRPDSSSMQSWGQGCPQHGSPEGAWITALVVEVKVARLRAANMGAAARVVRRGGGLR